jgi:hypothetical protein
MANVDELDSFIDESIRLSGLKGYYPRDFIRMRESYQTAPAIERLVKAGEIQSGFKELQKLNMLEWTIEAAVLKFPERFSAVAVKCADFRLRNIDDPILRGGR